jgi:hypothetical protein
VLAYFNLVVFSFEPPKINELKKIQMFFYLTRPVIARTPLYPCSSLGCCRAGRTRVSAGGGGPWLALKNTRRSTVQGFILHKNTRGSTVQGFILHKNTRRSTVQGFILQENTKQSTF